MNKNIKIIILSIILFFMIKRRFNKEGFNNLTTVNNSYKATQNQIKNLFQDKGGHAILNKHIHAPKGINMVGGKLYGVQVEGDAKFSKGKINIGGNGTIYGARLANPSIEGKINGGSELCLGGVCIDANHLRVLRGEKSFSMTSLRQNSHRNLRAGFGGECAGKTGAKRCDLVQTVNQADGDWERWRITAIRN